MSGRVVSFLRRSVPRDWSPQELAEFYRVEAALLQSGLRVSSDRGMTDEGDPWFVFCRADDEEVIVHFARIGGRFLISAPSFGADVVGHDFRALVRDLVDRHPVLQPHRRDDNVAFHPSALLVLLVASALLKTAHAAEAASASPHGSPSADAGRGLLRPVDATSPVLPELTTETGSQDWHQNAAILSAILLVTTVADASPAPTIVVSALAPELPAADHVSNALLALAPDSGPGGTPVGAGSISPTSPTPWPTPLSLMVDDPAHGHLAAFAQLLTPPAVEGGMAMPVDPGAGLSVILASLSGIQPPIQQIGGAATAEAMHADALSDTQGLAGTLLHALGGNEPILFTTALPDTFAAPLRVGVHTVADDTSPSQVHAAVAGAVTSPASASSVAATSPIPGEPAAASASGTTSTPTAPAPAAPPPLLSASEPPLLSASEMSAVLANMQAFSVEVGSHLTVLVTSNQVILYDSNAVDHTPAAVSAVTYEFADGSSVSLVGLPSELPHAPVM